jgi:hypothetical protein
MEYSSALQPTGRRHGTPTRGDAGSCSTIWIARWSMTGRSSFRNAPKRGATRSQAHHTEETLAAEQLEGYSIYGQQFCPSIMLVFLPERLQSLRERLGLQETGDTFG